MTTDFLDVDALPQVRTFEGSESTIQIKDLIPDIHTIVESLTGTGIISDNSSFGFSISILDGEDRLNNWDDAVALTWFAGGWGKDREKLIANAVRKCRVSARLDYDSLQCVSYLADDFVDIVDSVDENGNYPWGDFPWGGAAYVEFGGSRLLVATSGYTQYEDDFLAGIIGKFVGMKLHLASVPAE